MDEWMIGLIAHTKSSLTLTSIAIFLVFSAITFDLSIAASGTRPARLRAARKAVGRTARRRSCKATTMFTAAQNRMIPGCD